MLGFSRKTTERVFIFLIGLLTFLMVFPLFHIILTVFIKGSSVLMERGVKFLIETRSEGGIGPAIAGTLLLVALSSIIGIPLAFLAGIFISEYPESKIGQWTKTLLQTMMEFPTILVGVFVMQILVVPMGHYSAIAGAMALVIVMAPYIAVYTAEALREIPFTYKEAAYSLGLTRFKVCFRVLVPMAKKGILTGVLISIARIAGETAPLLFTIGGLYESYPSSITQPVGAISLLIYQLVQSPSPQDHAVAWGASLILLLIFLMIFIPVRLSIKEVRL